MRRTGILRSVVIAFAIVFIITGIANAAAPELLWKKTNSFCLTSPPLVGDDGYLYSTTGSCDDWHLQGPTALDPADGSIIWGPANQHPTCSWGLPAGSMGANGLIYGVGDWNECGDGILTSWSSVDGSIVWSRGTIQSGYSPHPRHTPAINDALNRVYFGSTCLHSIDMDSGQDSWVKSGGYYEGSIGMAIDSQNNIYYGTHKDDIGQRISSYTSDGVLRWAREFPVTGHSSIKLRGIFGNDILLVYHKPNDVLMAIDMNGQDLWSVPVLDFPVSDEAGNIYASSTICGELVALTSQGTEFWRTSLPGALTAKVDFADNAGHVYARGGNVLYAVNTSDGTVAWSFTADTDLRLRAILVPGGRIFLSDSNSTFYLLDTRLDYAASRWPIAVLGNRRHTCRSGDILPLPIPNEVNHSPVLDAIGNKSGSEGQLLEFTISATDPDIGDILAFSASNLPEGASFDPATATFSWVPGYDQEGYYENIEFSVMDNGDPVELDVELISITIGNVNRPPEFAPLGAQAVPEGELLQFNVVATDPDSDSIAISHSILPENATYNVFTGLFSWMPDNTQADNYTIIFYATDDGVPNLTGQLEVVITVGDVPSPTELADQLIEDITDLDLPKDVGNSYLANLKKVKKFIDDGKVTPAINQIHAFIKKVERDISNGNIEEADANILLAMATELNLYLVDFTTLEFNTGISGERLACDNDIKYYTFTLTEATTVAIVSTGTLDLKGRLYEISAGRIICIDADNNDEADQGDRRISNQFTDATGEEHDNFMLRPGNNAEIRLLPSGEYYLAVSLDLDSEDFDGTFGLLFLRRQPAGAGIIEDFFQGLEALIREDGNYIYNDYLDIYVRALFPDVYDNDWHCALDDNVIAERQCKALVNFYVKEIFGQGDCLWSDCTIDENLSSIDPDLLLQGPGLTIFNSASDPQYDDPARDPDTGDVWVMDTGLVCVDGIRVPGTYNHYGLYLDDDEIVDANWEWDGRLQISGSRGETKIVRPQ